MLPPLPSSRGVAYLLDALHEDLRVDPAMAARQTTSS